MIIHLVTYWDENFGNTRPRQGLAVTVEDCTAYSRTGRQATCAHCTAEAELVAGSWAARETIGVKNLLSEVFDGAQVIATMLGDNQAANLMASCQASVRKLRHIDLASLYVRTVTSNGTLNVDCIDGSRNIADILTKVVGEQKRKALMSGLCLFDP